MELSNLTSNQINLTTFSTLNLQNLCTHTNKLLTQLEESISNRWQNHLPDEILEIIYKRINTINDFNRMSVVCKSWHSSLAAIKPIPLATRPGLSFDSSDFTSSVLKTYANTPRYIIQQHIFYLDYDAENRLLRLSKLSEWPSSTFTYTDLLDITPCKSESESQQHVLSTRVEVHRCYHLDHTNCYLEGIKGSYDGPIGKILSLTETVNKDIDVVLLGLCVDGSLARWDAMTRVWCEVKVKTNTMRPFMYSNRRLDIEFVDVISYRNNFYAIDSESELYKVNQADWSLEKPIEPPPQYDHRFYHDSALVLLDSCGCLYLLRRSSEIQCMSSWRAPWSNSIEVYVLDENLGEWKAVKDLNNRVFIVLYKSIHKEVDKDIVAFSVFAEDMQQETGNCIFWFDELNLVKGNPNDWGVSTSLEYCTRSSLFEVGAMGDASWETSDIQPLRPQGLKDAQTVDGGAKGKSDPLLTKGADGYDIVEEDSTINRH